MDNLIMRLSEGEHPVLFESRTENLKDIKERIEKGFVFITFTGTKGGTELGIDIEQDRTDISDVDFEKNVGTLKIVGTCNLNYQKIRCIAKIDISTRKGSGYLIPIDESGNEIKSNNLHKN